MLNDALNTMYNAEKRGNRQALIRPSSKVITKYLLVIQKHGMNESRIYIWYPLWPSVQLWFLISPFCFPIGYIGEFEYVDDHRSGKIVVELIGRLNKCGVISPRFDVSVKEIESWTARLLPSRQVSTQLLYQNHIYMAWWIVLTDFFVNWLKFGVWVHYVDNLIWNYGPRRGEEKEHRW